MLHRRSIAIGIAGALACMVAIMPNLASGVDLAPLNSPAPDFTLPSQENKPISLSDYKGKWVVLYFYPKDQTSGCTLEAHNFQRDLAKYRAMNAVILGVSLDTVESHKAFCTKDSLTFKLLADPGRKAVDMYGVAVRSFGATPYAERVTFLISPEDKIVKEWAVTDIQSHSAAVLTAISSYKQ